jgi:hypothetical protein
MTDALACPDSLSRATLPLSNPTLGPGPLTFYCLGDVSAEVILVELLLAELAHGLVGCALAANGARVAVLISGWKTCHRQKSMCKLTSTPPCSIALLRRSWSIKLNDCFQVKFSWALTASLGAFQKV